MQQVYALVLAGGSGTRFWPASRRLRPKQLLPIAPGSRAPLIAEAVARLRALCPAERVLVSTGAHLLDATRQALPEIPAGNFLAEPFARNTAPCIAWAASVIARRDPKAVVMVIPSDQHVANDAEYAKVLRRAIDSALSGVITTVGIRPSRPETGYGYIEVESVNAAPGTPLPGKAFVEKPDRATAEKYLARGTYYWNSGMFFFRAVDMLAALKQHMPELTQGLAEIEQAERVGPAAEAAAVERAFASWPSVSIDYGVMEKLSGIRVVPADMGWSDLGSWQAAWELSSKDKNANVATGDILFEQSSGNLVSDLSTQRRVIALVGVQDLCVVQTDDALLVIPREQSQDVRAIIDRLKAAGREDLL